MALAFSHLDAGPALRAFLADQLATRDALNLDIHDDDEMFIGARTVGMGIDAVSTGGYFKAGHQLMFVIRQIAEWRFGGFDRVDSVLDFACGYGRLTRFLVLEVPPDRVWASDIYAGGVAFVERVFGVHGVVSVTDPAAYSLEPALRPHRRAVALQSPAATDLRRVAASSLRPARHRAACSRSACRTRR